MSKHFNEWQATQQQLDAVKRFDNERIVMVKLVLEEWERKEKLKKEGKKTKSKITWY